MSPLHWAIHLTNWLECKKTSRDHSQRMNWTIFIFNFTLKINLWPSGNKCASWTFNLKRTTAASKRLHFRVYWCFYETFSTQQGFGRVMSACVAQFCLVTENWEERKNSEDAGWQIPFTFSGETYFCLIETNEMRWPFKSE